jgi:hypothetical protein
MDEVTSVSYQISKRYSDFLKLYTSLSSRNPPNPRVQLFNFPKKSLINSRATKENRKARLEDFLKMITEAFDKPPVELEDFIEIKSHLPIARTGAGTNRSVKS